MCLYSSTHSLRGRRILYSIPYRHDHPFQLLDHRQRSSEIWREHSQPEEDQTPYFAIMLSAVDLEM